MRFETPGENKNRDKRVSAAARRRTNTGAAKRRPFRPRGFYVSAGEIGISAADGNGSIEIRIADRGPGVPDEALEKLFDPFYRVETHRSRETGGTGLGLAIVKTCVEACGGKVSARNLAPTGFEATMLLKN